MEEFQRPFPLVTPDQLRTKPKPKPKYFRWQPGYEAPAAVVSRRYGNALDIGFSEREARILARGELGLKYTSLFWQRLREVRGEEMRNYLDYVKTRTGVVLSKRQAAEDLAMRKGHLSVFDIAEELY